MATPYNPLAIPYQIHTKELPANQTAAAAVPAAIVSTSTWSQSPYFTPNWGDETQGPQPPPYLPGPGTPAQGPAQALNPVTTAAVTRPDAAIAGRDAAAITALNSESARLTAVVNTANAQITAITNIGANAGPTVMSAYPSVVTHGVATSVTLQGSGFSVSGGVTAVNIGGACTSIVVANDGQLTCLTPAASVAGTSDVVVTTGKGSDTLTGGLVYT